MGILANILGGGKVIEEGFKLIDSIHTSDTEMIEAKTKAKTELMAAYAPFKRAQRYLALMFTVTFLTCFVIVMAMALTGRADIEIARGVIDEFWIGEIMMMIVGFYFAGGMVEGGFRARKNEP